MQHSVYLALPDLAIFYLSLYQLSTTTVYLVVHIYTYWQCSMLNLLYSLIPNRTAWLLFDWKQTKIYQTICLYIRLHTVLIIIWIFASKPSLSRLERMLRPKSAFWARYIVCKKDVMCSVFTRIFLPEPPSTLSFPYSFILLFTHSLIHPFYHSPIQPFIQGTIMNKSSMYNSIVHICK